MVHFNAFLALSILGVASALPLIPRAADAATQLQNGQKAQQLNTQFASLTATSSCDPATQAQACVGGQFAQCVGGTFMMSACSGGTQCFALPLVNSAGTSVTCDTQADAEARITNSGATGGLTGSDASSSDSASSSSAAATADAPTAAAPATAAPATTSADAAATTPLASTSSSTSGFALQNGQDAQKLNKSFQSLSITQSCDPTTQASACVNGGFSQCVNGQFSTPVQCGAGLSCFALPLVNSAGTSVTCASQSDVESRIAATGATGGISG